MENCYPKKKKKLNELLSHLHKKWSFITPDQFFKLIESKAKIEKPTLLVTFDDGFKNNLKACEILSDLNIKSIFYITSGLINKKNLFFYQI